MSRRRRRLLPALLGPALALALAVGGLWLHLGGTGLASVADAGPDAGAQTAAVVAAATGFLDALTPAQRAGALFPFGLEAIATVARFTRTAPGAPVREMTAAEAARAAALPPPGPPPDAASSPRHGPPGPGSAPPPGGVGFGPPGGFTGERYGQAVWSNFPVSDVPRTGLQLGSLTTVQREAALHLLRVLLSPRGYAKVRDIMASDQALADGGTPFASGEAVYTLGLFGTPSATAPWMIGFGGHHLGLNVVIAGAHGVMTPTLTGAQPAVFAADGHTVRVLAGENDKAFALLDALDPAQRQQAVLPYRVGDLVLGPDHPAATIVPEGLRGSAMTARQRAILMELVAEWAGIVGDAYARPRLEEIRAGLDDTWFAWSGPLAHAPGRNGSSYYRIQGPRLVIEFAPQDTNGDATQHVHTVYRDPTDEYGVRFTRP